MVVCYDEQIIYGLAWSAIDGIGGCHLDDLGESGGFGLCKIGGNCNVDNEEVFVGFGWVLGFNIGTVGFG